jgi:hypothetical protein
MSVQSGFAGVDMEKAESVRGSEYVEPFKAWKWELSGALIPSRIPYPAGIILWI